MPAVKSRRILYRIILPFTALFGLITVFSWILSSYLITRTLDRDLGRQMEQVAGLLSKSGFISNPAVLRQLKDVVRAEIVLFDPAGRVFGQTFSNTGQKPPVDRLLPAPANRSMAVRDMVFQGVRYRVVLNSLNLAGHGPAYLSLWTPARESGLLKIKIIYGTGAIALFGVLAVAGAGFLIARTITAPLEELARITGQVAEGDLTPRLKVGSRDEIGRLAESFNLMIDQLESYERRLVATEKLATAGQMAAGLAHEIRNPLTSIKMLGQVLQNRLPEASANRQILVNMIQEIDRLDRIIQEMIHRTRPGDPAKAWCDLNREIDEVAAVAEERFLADGIRLVVEQDEHLPPVYMDGPKIKQVLWNLMLNAREAMPRGGRLVVSTGREGADMVRILVDDTGTGLGDHDHERFFQAFFSTKPEGVGLGLTMSREIVEKHGGRLTLAGRPEGGVRAAVLLPVRGV